jgi:hypothetical protein
MVGDFLVSCMAVAQQEGFFCMALINIDCGDNDYRNGISSKEGRWLWENIKEPMVCKWAKEP